MAAPAASSTRPAWYVEAHRDVLCGILPRLSDGIRPASTSPSAARAVHKCPVQTGIGHGLRIMLAENGSSHSRLASPWPARRLRLRSSNRSLAFTLTLKLTLGPTLGQPGLHWY